MDAVFATARADSRLSPDQSSKVEKGARSSESVYQLQEFFFPKSAAHLDLYVRKLSGELSYGKSIHTYGNAHLSFNTYFNSFFESYWTGHTALETIFLQITGKGRFWCNVFRETGTQGTSLIARAFVELEPDGAPEVCIDIPLITKGHGHGGRIFADIETVTPATITGMSWATHQPPLYEVALGVGICTFNREPFVTRTIRHLLEAEADAAVFKVVVVNQGAPLTSKAFAAVAAHGGSRLQVLDQANFGGAGGFARCAMELLEQDEVTHVLFMDDDIDLDARHLATAAAFLRYTSSRTVVGGHMLDLFRRHILYEAGNAISPDNQLKPNHHNLDLNQLTSMSALSSAAPAHFNGWWFSAIPLSCFRDFGLPAPIFIRGDDMEYGTRLHRAGIETVALAPVSVWHEPFYAKPPGWQLYYDLRNRLILASFNNDMFSLESPSRLLKLLMVHLIRYDYQHAWFMLHAVLDFLKGPELIQEGLPAIHQRIMQQSAELAPGKMRNALGLDAAIADAPDRPAAIRRRMLFSLARVLTGAIRRRPLGVLYTDTPLQWIGLGPSYILTDRENHFFLRYAYSKRDTWRLLIQATTAVLKYRRERGRVARAWKTAHADLVSLQNWRSMLGMSASDGRGKAET